jgi:3-methyladenine DNA glycosylase AlkD
MERSMPQREIMRQRGAPLSLEGRMQTQEAVRLGERIAALVAEGQTTKAYTLVAPVLAQRTPFRLLGRIGEAVGAGSLQEVNRFLERIAQGRAEGGWVVIGSALGQQFGRDPAGSFARCRDFVVVADVWYATDILGERLPGPALLAQFQAAVDLLTPWRDDANRWVRRTVGIAVHFWAKRSRGAESHVAQAAMLLALLEPLFEERDMDALKGIGWGLKTLGRHYPDLTTDWLTQQVTERGHHPRALMLRKALTYLPPHQRSRITLSP